MQRVFIKPAHEDVPVRYPDGRGQLPKEGQKLKLNLHWQRLAKNGDVVIIKADKHRK